MRQNKVPGPCLYNLRKPHSRRNTTNMVPVTTEQQLKGIAGVLCYSMFYNFSHNNLGNKQLHQLVQGLV